MLIVGVNGAGKTTFIGKLAARLRARGQAGDGRGRRHLSRRRHRSAARVGRAHGRGVRRRAAGRPIRPPWRSTPSTPPSRAASTCVIVDTAGRLHTSDGLMEELRKVARVIAKRLPGAPHETLLVLDGTIGQNAVAQAKTFAAAVPVTGLVVTKLDGTARGGVVVAVHEAIDVPVKFVGVGEAGRRSRAVRRRGVRAGAAERRSEHAARRSARSALDTADHVPQGRRPAPRRGVPASWTSSTARRPALARPASLRGREHGLAHRDAARRRRRHRHRHA